MRKGGGKRLELFIFIMLVNYDTQTECAMKSINK